MHMETFIIECSVILYEDSTFKTHDAKTFNTKLKRIMNNIPKTGAAKE